MRIAILDDYQRVALSCAGWETLPGAPEITVFTEHIAGTADLVAALEPFDVIVAMRERTPFTAERLGKLPELHLLVTTGMVNASIDLAAARSRGVAVCGTRGSGAATAELTWGLILALVRHIPAEDQRIRAGGWQHTVGFGLRGRTLGIAGLGRQGRQVAAIGRAFGMELLAWSQNLDPAAAREAGADPVSKQELFSRSDIVTVHYALGPRSTGIVGASDLARMKPTAYLVNTSRGPIVDTDALLAVLHAGKIAGAALDVYDTEPLPGDHPLRSAPRTVLTPHLGYVADDAYRSFYAEAVEDIAAFAQGAPLRVLNP
jgi:phosphoglycerate dehydrogenase-like enzyme